MARIIRLHGGGHQEVAELLPWYVTGQLDSDERIEVERHLQVCAECQAEVRFQRRLDEEIAELPLDVEEGWRLMRGRLEREGSPRARAASWLALAGRRAAPWFGGIAAGLMLALGASAWSPSLASWTGAPQVYHALGARAPAPAANLIVIFRPETSEADLRALLRASGARLTGGPTEADGYLLQAPAAGRDAALAKLRASKAVVLAEPLDSEAGR